MSLMSAPATGPKCHQCERQFEKSYGCKWWGWVGCQGDFTRVKRQWLGCDLLCRFTDELHTAWPWLPPGIVLSKRRSITTPTPIILPKHHGRENCTAMKSVDRSKTCLEQPMDLNEKSGKENFNLFKLCGDQCKAMCISLMVDKCSSAIIVWTAQPWAQSLINSWKSGTPPGKQEKMWPTRRWRESTDSVTGRITPGSITPTLKHHPAENLWRYRRFDPSQNIFQVGIQYIAIYLVQVNCIVCSSGMQLSVYPSSLGSPAHLANCRLTKQMCASPQGDMETSRTETG